jgi:hypothetical protein
VVAAIGAYHSGKSFLMNQLMGAQEGFALGPTVAPQTKVFASSSIPSLPPLASSLSFPSNICVRADGLLISNQLCRVFGRRFPSMKIAQ